MTQPGIGLKNLANMISLARLCAVPVAVWLVLRGHFPAAFMIFAAAGISDAIDGYLARRYGSTLLGSVLDPLADKALMVGMYVTLAGIGILPDFLAILVVFRDLLIVGGVLLLWMFDRPPAIAPLAISKVNTALQLVLVGVVLGLAAAGMQADALRAGLIGLVGLSTLASGIAYVRAASRHLVEGAANGG